MSPYRFFSSSTLAAAVSASNWVYLQIVVLYFSRTPLAGSRDRAARTLPAGNCRGRLSPGTGDRPGRADGLAGYLRDRSLRQIFMIGLATDFCVHYSAVDARRLGFDTVLVESGCRAIDLAGSLDWPG